MTCNCKKQYRCADCGNVQTPRSYCAMCSGTTLLPITQHDKGIKTHAEYMEARSRLDELREIKEPTVDEKQEKRNLAMLTWIYDERVSRR
jgi:hypothetical protein